MEISNGAAMTVRSRSLRLQFPPAFANNGGVIATNSLMGMAPVELPTIRRHRYLGDQMSATLADLEPESQAAVRQLYALLQRAHQTLRDFADHSPVSDAAAEELSSRSLWSELAATGQRVGRGRTRYPEIVGRVLHDLRGGSLVALIGTVQMLPFSRSRPVDVQRCAHFARDHLKIMRNCLPELDPDGVRHDQEPRAHAIDLLVDKWAGSEFKFRDVNRRIQFNCTFRGTISERCLEFSAIDRVIYNLVNNAVAHTADGDVALSIFPVGAGDACNVRFVVSNAINPADAERIRALTHGQVESLMKGGVSTTDGGMGLRICAEFVGHAYGLPSVDEVLRGGYAGTRIIDDTFVSWFHWPSAP